MAHWTGPTSSDVWTRVEAVLGLADTKPLTSEVVEALMAALDDPEVVCAEAANESLSVIGRPIVPALIDRNRVGTPASRRRALSALACVAEVSPEVLVPPVQRREVNPLLLVRELGCERAWKCRKALFEAVRDTGWIEPVGSRELCPREGRASLARSILDGLRLKTERDGLSLYRMARSLRWTLPESLPLLLEGLESASDLVRACTRHALAIGENSLRPISLAMLLDPSKRAYARELLGLENVPIAAALPRLVEALKDDALCPVALHVLRNSGVAARSTMPELLSAARRQGRGQRAEDMLGALVGCAAVISRHSQRLIPAGCASSKSGLGTLQMLHLMARENLHAYRNHRNPTVRAWALAEYCQDHPDDLGAHRRGLRDPKSEVRSSVLMGLRVTRRVPRDVVDLIIERIHDEDHGVQEHALAVVCGALVRDEVPLEAVEGTLIEVLRGQWPAAEDWSAEGCRHRWRRELVARCLRKVGARASRLLPSLRASYEQKPLEAIARAYVRIARLDREKGSDPVN